MTGLTYLHINHYIRSHIHTYKLIGFKQLKKKIDTFLGKDCLYFPLVFIMLTPLPPLSLTLGEGVSCDRFFLPRRGISIFFLKRKLHVLFYIVDVIKSYIHTQQGVVFRHNHAQLLVFGGAFFFQSRDHNSQLRGDRCHKSN